MRLLFCLLLCRSPIFTVLAADDWQSALRQMPLSTNVTQLNRENCVKLMLNSFQSNANGEGLDFHAGRHR